MDITQHEIQALKTAYNLADAHTHQSQSPSQKNIVERLPSLWYEAETKTQYAAEQAFLRSFFELHNQPTAVAKGDKVYLVYAASIAMQITAMYLAKQSMKVALQEPCFDNLHDLLKHMQVPLQPIREEALEHPDVIYGNLKFAAKEADAVFLVDPNNPTGFTLLQHGAKAFEEVVRFCRDYNKLLILDVCFASFALMDPSLGRFDIYELLDKSGVSYISMEDTGKTWPLQDAKCAMLLASDDINQEIYDLVTAVLLNVSPFVLSVVREYVEDSKKDGFASVRDLLERNREIAKRLLQGTVLEYCNPIAKTSVCWFKINEPGPSATDLHERMLARGVYTLPGKYFYWNEPEIGERYIRIALARDTSMFEPAMMTLRELLVES